MSMYAGTPIQNSLKDLWPLMKFLNMEPFQDQQWWERTIERPVSRGDDAGIKRVKALLGPLTLRRLKTQLRNGEPIVKLPKRDVLVEHVRLSDEERRLYDAMQTQGKLIVDKWVTFIATRLSADASYSVCMSVDCSVGVVTQCSDWV